MMLKRVLMTAGLIPLLLSGCGGSGSSGSGGGNTPTTTSVLKIDEMTDVPVMNGTSTKGTLYVHNYGDKAVTGVSYSLKGATTSSKMKSLLSKAGLNLGGLEDANGFVLLNPERCTSIAANSSCAINFATPNLSFGNRGSSLVTVNYDGGSGAKSSQQVVNYSYMNPSLYSGVNFTGSLKVSGTQGSTQYVVGYLYGSGSTGTRYNGVNLSSSNPSTRINGGFINGQEVVSNQVIAVEFAVALQSNRDSYVNITPEWGVSSLKLGTVSTGIPLSLTLTPELNTVNYIFGNVPILNAPTSSNTVISVVNNGNASGGGITATKSGGSNADELTINTSDCSGGLSANATDSCQISFSVSGYTPGSTTVQYVSSTTGAVIGTQQVVWTNDKPYPMVEVIVSPSTTPNAPYQFGKRHTSEDITYTFRNLGKAPLESVTYPYTLTGPATWTESSNTCSSTIGVGVNSECVITGTLYGADDGTGVMYQFAKGNYGERIYNFVSYLFSYQVTSNPILSISPAEVLNWTVSANNSSRESQLYTVQNNGNDPAIFTSLNMSPVTTTYKPSITGGSCTASTTLNENGTCTVLVSYGPITSAATANESGTTNVVIGYQGGTPVTSYASSSSAINYNLVGNDSYLVESMTATGLTGDGSAEDPYYGTPASSPLKITLTVTNPSANYPMTNFNLNTNNLPYGVTVDPSSTCTTGSAVRVLNMNETCTLILLLDRELLKTSSQGGSTAYSFAPPVATWTTPLGFYSQPGVSNINVNYLQPTVTFSLSQNNAYFESTVLSMVLTNESAADTTPLRVNVHSVYDWLESVPVSQSSNCSVNQGSYAAYCDLGGTEPATGNISYVMPNYLTTLGESAYIPLVYSTDSYAYLNPSYQFITFLNTGSACTSCRIFVTPSIGSNILGANLVAVANSSPVSANLPLGSSGFDGGDAICQYYAGVNGYSGTYKAMIAGPNRIPGGSDWVLHANTPMIRASDNTALGTTTNNGQLPNPLLAPILVNGAQIFTGFEGGANPWAVASSNNAGNCNNWTSSSNGFTTTGSAGSGIQTYSSFLPGPPLVITPGYLNGLGLGCDNSGAVALYCVQQ